MKTGPKTFDCVEMKRRGALAVHQRLQGLNRDQILEYWRKRREELMKQQARIKAEK